MNEEDEILDFDDNVDFSLSEDPQAANSNLSEGDGFFDLDAEMSFAVSVQQTEDSTEGKNKETSELIELTGLPESVELDNNSTLSQQKDQEEQEELKFSEIDGFDMDPDFLNQDYEGVNVDDVTIEDDEFWKELGLDPPNEIEKEENEKPIEGSGTPDNLDTPKKSTSSQSDTIKVNSTTKLDISSNKSVKRTSKSPEKEDGEILNTSTSADNKGQQQSQKQKSSQSQQQVQTQRQTQTQRTQAQRQQQQNNSHQQQNLHRGRGGRNWRPPNNSSFLNSGFRSGFGPGLEGMPGMPMGQIPINNPPMIPIPPGMIGPNIHVNPNFARLRPHALPFGNPYPMGSGGPPMSMMQYQGQMDMHPYHHSITPMGRGNNNSYTGRGGSPGFNHNSISPRRPTSQQNNNQAQRSIQPSPKRKVPNDGFDQKEPDSKKISVINGKSSAPDAKSASAPQKNTEKSKSVSPPTTKNSSSPPAAKASNSKQGASTANTNKTMSAATKNKTALATSNTSSSTSTSTKQIPKPVQKPTPKNTVRNTPSKSSAASSPKSKPATKNDGASSTGSNKLTIGNVVKNVTKRDIQDLANKVPIGFSSITFDRSAQTAEVVFETSEGAKMFRRMHNRSLLYGSNIVINFS